MLDCALIGVYAEISSNTVAAKHITHYPIAFVRV